MVPELRAGLSPLSCRVPRDTQFRCHDLARFLHGHIFRQDAIFHETDHAVLCILVKFFGHVRRFSHLLKRNKTWDTSFWLAKHGDKLPFFRAQTGPESGVQLTRPGPGFPPDDS